MPNEDMSYLSQEDKAQAFLETLDWLLTEIIAISNEVYRVFPRKFREINDSDKPLSYSIKLIHEDNRFPGLAYDVEITTPEWGSDNDQMVPQEHRLQVPLSWLTLGEEDLREAANEASKYWELQEAQRKVDELEATKQKSREMYGRLHKKFGTPT